MKIFSTGRCILLMAVLLPCLMTYSNAQISPDSLKKHVYFLASDSLEGRNAGSAGSQIAAEYIVREFSDAGIKPLVEGYYQHFIVPQSHCKNILGVIEGSDPVLKNEYIVLGAHYDHIGFNMTNDSTMAVFNGADDNASGTSAIIEVGRLLAQNRELLKRSVIIAAFDAEERGLLGSTYFIDHTPVDKKNIKAMMSIDMVGWLKKSGKVVFSGCGSFDDGVRFMNNIKRVDSLNAIFIHSSFMWHDMTDTKPFYGAGIPCMYVSTGLESPYHKHEDDADLIDYSGMKLVSDQVYNATLALSSKENFKFEKTKESVQVIEGPVKFGISLGYNSNYFNYSEGPYLAKPLSGFTGGFAAGIKLTSYLTFQPEFLYSYYGSQSGDGNVRLHSVEIPLRLFLITPPAEFRAFIHASPYVNYSFDGSIGGKTIDWEKQRINRLDWGVESGVGFEIFNFQLMMTGKQGINNFYMDKLPGFGKARNITYVISLGYFFLH